MRETHIGYFQIGLFVVGLVLLSFSFEEMINIQPNNCRLQRRRRRNLGSRLNLYLVAVLQIFWLQWKVTREECRATKSVGVFRRLKNKENIRRRKKRYESLNAMKLQFAVFFYLTYIFLFAWTELKVEGK